MVGVFLTMGGVSYYDIPCIDGERIFWMKSMFFEILRQSPTLTWIQFSIIWALCSKKYIFFKKYSYSKLALVKVWNPLRIFRSHVFRKKILSRWKMKEIAPKFQNMTSGSRATHLKFTKFCAGGRCEITLGFAKILFPLWDKSMCVLQKFHRMKFWKNLTKYIPWSSLHCEKLSKGFNS